MIGLHQVAAALYLAAGVTGAVGVSLPAAQVARAAVWILGAGGLIHAISFAFLHRTEPTPQLTDLAAVISLAACMAVLFYMAFLRRARWHVLVVAVAPIGFLGAFFGALRLPGEAVGELTAAGSWPHVHVILATAGLALLGVAGLAGLVFLRESAQLKSKRPGANRSHLPSLEALDRVNVVSLAVGFPLLTLGLVTGMFWVHGMRGVVWTGSAHEIWTSVAWAIYAVLVVSRFGVHQSARSAALSALGGFAFLVFAVVGVGMVT